MRLARGVDIRMEKKKTWGDTQSLGGWAYRAQRFDFFSMSVSQRSAGSTTGRVCSSFALPIPLPIQRKVAVYMCARVCVCVCVYVYLVWCVSV